MITSPDCADAALVWDMSIDTSKYPELPSDYLHVTMDQVANVFRVTALPGNEIFGRFEVDIVITDPALNTWTYPFVLNFAACEKPTIFPPFVETQYYTVGDPYKSYTPPLFTFSDADCAGNEYYSNQVIEANTFITGINDG